MQVSQQLSSVVVNGWLYKTGSVFHHLQQRENSIIPRDINIVNGVNGELEFV